MPQGPIDSPIDGPSGPIQFQQSLGYPITLFILWAWL
jgi:hypothetical protein